MFKGKTKKPRTDGEPHPYKYIATLWHFAPHPPPLPLARWPAPAPRSPPQTLRLPRGTNRPHTTHSAPHARPSHTALHTQPMTFPIRNHPIIPHPPGYQLPNGAMSRKKQPRTPDPTSPIARKRERRNWTHRAIESHARCRHRTIATTAMQRRHCGSRGALPHIHTRTPTLASESQTRLMKASRR